MDLRPYLTPNRKISSRFVSFAARSSLEPNQVTTAGLIFGVLAGVFMAHGTRPGMLWGALCFNLAAIFDQCDGAIARFKGRTSRFGAGFDLAADFIAEIALWTGLAAGTLARSPHSVRFVLLAWSAALAGSVVHFGLILLEKSKGIGPAFHGASAEKERRRNSSFHSILDLLGDNESTPFVWAFALIGYPVYLLAAGAVFMNALWLTRLIVNRGILFAPSRIVIGSLPALFIPEFYTIFP